MRKVDHGRDYLVPALRFRQVQVQGLCGSVPCVVFVLMAWLIPGTLPAVEPRAAVSERVIMGWLETFFLEPDHIRFTAKLDTGAKTSSVHADHIENFSKGGVPWVRFDFAANKDDAPIKIEKPLVRTAVIKERLSRSSTRGVVKLNICKDGRNYETEFTLNDRSNFNYPILLGRSFLADVALVDSSATFLHKGDVEACSQKADNQRP